MLTSTLMHRTTPAISCLLTALLCSTSLAQVSVLGPRERPADTRLGPLRGEVGDFTFSPADSADQWQLRSQRVRRIMRVSMGLWPMPTRSEIEPVMHGRLDLGDYTIEKVYFESVPGFYVTGNLYRPKGMPGRRPAVLSPHGHFPGGRFQDEGLETVRGKINRGAERFENGGRSFMQSRCVQLARMGCVVFHYDMIGYGDSQQIPLDVAHRFSGLRTKFNQPSPSGLYSAPALLNLHNSLGLHTFNSIRALDFLLALPDVDPDRIAVTGGSGGGTQSFMLCAVDDRPLVSVPVVIVSTTRQGGCTCENICGLRIGTYNLEFTALHSPKPLMLISADDATRTMAQRGFPILRRHYEALASEQNLAHAPLVQFPHNYNHVSRTAMYHWLNRHLELGISEPIIERPYRRLTRKELSVWNAEHPRPQPMDGFQSRLWGWFERDTKRQLAEIAPRDASTLAKYRDTVGTAWKILIRGLPQDPGLHFRQIVANAAEGHQQTAGLLHYKTVENHHASLPVLRLVPPKSNGKVVLWLHSLGKAGLYRPGGELMRPIRKLLEAGFTVVGVDLLYQGEFLDEGDANPSNRWLDGEQGYGGWTYCYNQPLFARRVHDVLAAAQWLGSDAAVDLVSIDGTAPWAVAAVAQAPDLFGKTAVNTAGFRFSDQPDIYGADFQPGAAKYGDLPGLLALCSPKPLWIAGENSRESGLVKAAYAAAGNADCLTMLEGDTDQRIDRAIDWLLK